MSTPNKTLQILLILPLSGRAQVIVRREFYFKSVTLNCKDVRSTSQLNMPKEKPCCQNAHLTPPRHLKPTLC